MYISLSTPPSVHCAFHPHRLGLLGPPLASGAGRDHGGHGDPGARQVGVAAVPGGRWAASLRRFCERFHGPLIQLVGHDS